MEKESQRLYIITSGQNVSHDTQISDLVQISDEIAEDVVNQIDQINMKNVQLLKQIGINLSEIQTKMLIKPKNSKCQQ